MGYFETMSNRLINGKLVIISGPSGVGKSTIAKQVIDALGAFLSISTTTRQKSENEQDGREYGFVSREEFERRIERDEFLEYAEVFGNYYGTPLGPIEEAIASGRTVILEIDVQGALQVLEKCPNALTIFILPPHKQDLEKRISGRGRGEDALTRQRRLAKAGTEIAAAWQHYDHLVINENLDHAVQEVIDIIKGKFED